MAIPPQEVSAERALVFWPESDDRNEDVADVLSSTAPLRVRQVEFVGFKSFPDRTVVRFPSRVTAIVGPNGCGKSNVVDAVRWVLGEQSSRRLRGDAMEDVIFRGSDHRGPLGMAQVSILLEMDGSQGVLQQGRNGAGPSEIMVTRRYFRSGESEYLMNGTPCRLRDITEFFLGTGLGNKAYAIIEQDRVGQLVRAKPEEIRTFIEEAAGTTLYRSRREVAERKMERTRENLQRTQDLLREVERNLAGLRRQAKRAEQYRALQREIEDLEVGLSGRERARLLIESSQLESERAANIKRQAELAAALEHVDRARTDAREQEGKAHDQLRAGQAATFESRTAAEACRHEIARLEAQVTELSEQANAAERDLLAATEELRALTADRGAAKDALAALAREVASIEGALAAMLAEVEQVTSDLAAAERDVQSSKDGLLESLTDETRVRNSRALAEERRTEAAARCARLEANLRALRERETQALSHGEAAERRVVDLQERLERLEGAKRQHVDDLRRAVAERTNWEGTLEGIKEGLARARSRRDSLRELDESRAGYGEGVRAILAASEREEILGLVAEVLEIPAEHERAVAAVLGEQLQAVVTRDEEVARDAVQALRRAGAGRAICIPTTVRSPGSIAVPEGRRLLDCVAARQGCERVAESLLGHVVLVDDLDRALALWRRNGTPATFVTPAGETLSAAGILAGGSERGEERLLAERRELRSLQQEVQRRERDFETARMRYEALNGGVAAREAQLEAVDAELAQATLAVVAAEKDVERGRQELADLKAQIAAVFSELEEMRTLAAEHDGVLLALSGDLTRVQARSTELEAQVTGAEARLAAGRQRSTELRDAITERRVTLAEKRVHVNGEEATVDRLDRGVEDARERIALLTGRRSSDAEGLRAARCATQAARERLAALEEDVRRREGEVRAAEAGIAEARTAMAHSERVSAELHAELENLRTRAGTLDVQIAERKLTVGHLEQTIRERYQRELGHEAVTSGAAEDALVQHGRLEHLRQRLADMGAVNVAALGEVAEQEERHRLLETQRADIERALDDLRKTITRLNRASRTRFRDTFERVDRTFQEVFPKLFQGGRAHLRLTDEEHLLESGVEIVVQPPGKRVGPLDLLSGGEKALTAVSLIFALFLIKPSPFCFLDEVDAPLDDANIGRFTRMVKEMSGHSQFILITHNKRTMEVAETLYGITNEEPGVSRVVSVRLPE